MDMDIWIYSQVYGCSWTYWWLFFNKIKIRVWNIKTFQFVIVSHAHCNESLQVLCINSVMTQDCESQISFELMFMRYKLSALVELPTAEVQDTSSAIFNYTRAQLVCKVLCWFNKKIIIFCQICLNVHFSKSYPMDKLTHTCYNPLTKITDLFS